MGQAIGQMLPIAVAVMLSPTGSLVAIFMLSSAGGRAKGAAYLAGWTFSIAAAGGVLLLIVDGIDATDDGEPATWVSVLLLFLGLLLFFLAVKQWRGRPRAGDPPKEPLKWMTALDGLSAAKAAGAAVLLGGLSPKNLLLIFAGVAIIAEAGIPAEQQVVVLALFVVIASLGVAIPVALSFAPGERAARMLEGLKDWLGRNTAVVMTVVLVVFGFELVGKGISGLST